MGKKNPTEAERLKKLPKVLTHLFKNTAFKEKGIDSHSDENGNYCFVTDFLNSQEYLQYKESDFHKLLATNETSDTPDSFILKKINDRLAVIYVQKDSPATCDIKQVEENRFIEAKEEKKETARVNDTESANEVADETATGQKSHQQNNDGQNSQNQDKKKKKKKTKNPQKKGTEAEERSNEVVHQEEPVSAAASAVAAPAAVAVNEEDNASDDADWENQSNNKKSKNKKKGIEDKKKDDSKTSKEGKAISGSKQHSGEEEKSRTNEISGKSHRNNSLNSSRNEQKRQNTSDVDNSKKMKPDSLEAKSKKEESKGASKNSIEVKTSLKDSPKDLAKRFDKLERILAFAFKRDGIKKKEVTVNQDGSVRLDELLEKCNGSMFLVDEVAEYVNDSKSSDYECSQEGQDFYIRFIGKKEPEKPAAAATAGATANTGNTAASHAKYTSDGGYGNKRGPYQQRKRESEDDIFLSKTMSYLLRHGAEKQRLPIGTDGYMFVKDLLGYREFEGYYKEEDVIRVVQNNDKQRFQLTTDSTGSLKVRANQGHSLEVNDLELTAVKSPAEIPTVVHGTYLESWSKIKTEGMKCMNRNHMHFARGEPGENGVISGMRSTCEVMIYIDAEKAMKDGYKFFISANGVILCPGNADGVLPPKYFKEAMQRKPWKRLL